MVCSGLTDGKTSCRKTSIEQCFLVQGGFVYKGPEVLGNCYVRHFHLAVAQGVIGGGCGVSNLEQLEKIFGQLGTEFFSLVSDDLKRYSKTTKPPLQDGRGHR